MGTLLESLVSYKKSLQEVLIRANMGFKSRMGHTKADNNKSRIL